MRFFIRQVFQPLLLDLADGDTVPALLPSPPEFMSFEFVVGECQEITEFVRHGLSFSLLFVVSKMMRARHTDKSS